MVSRSLVQFGPVGIELACIPAVGKALGAKVGVGEPLGSKVEFLSIAFKRFTVCSRLWYFAPLEGGNGVGSVQGVELGGNMPFVWRRDRTWRIMAGTSDAVAVDPFNVSINSVSSRFVLVTVPGTKGNELSWGNHWSVSWVLVLLVDGL